MKTFKFNLILLAVIRMMTIILSCKKENEEPEVSDTAFSQDDTFAKGVFDNVTSMTDEAFEWDYI
jgi:hypothetical protein